MGSIHLLPTVLTENLSLEKVLEISTDDHILYRLETIEIELMTLDSFIENDQDGKRELENCLDRLQESLNWYRAFKS